MTERIRWSSAEDIRVIAPEVSRRLRDGLGVVVPTSSTYALAVRADRLPGLIESLPTVFSDPWSSALCMTTVEQALDSCRSLSARGIRLMERGFPGPLTVVAHASASVRSMWKQQDLCVRMPDHPASLESIRLAGPGIALVEGSATTAEDAEREFGAPVAYLVDAGPTPFSNPTTVVDTREGAFKVVREGVLPAARIARLGAEIITFVCTGNSCRSPMAEAIFRIVLSKALGCSPEELEDRGFIIQSAGLAALDGAAASPEAQTVAREYQSSLDDHVAQSLTPQMVRFSDHLIVMTKDHRSAILSMWPEASSKTRLLADPANVSDPIGQGLSRYRRTAEQMLEHLQAFAEHIKHRVSRGN